VSSSWPTVSSKRKAHQSKFSIIHRTIERKRSWRICY